MNRLVLGLIVITTVVVSLAAVVVDASSSPYLRLEWSGPWSIQEISLVQASSTSSDNPSGRYLVVAGGSRTRFDYRVQIPVARQIFFYDTRSPDPAFPTGYQGLWLLQGTYWSTGASGYCWIADVNLSINDRNRLSIAATFSDVGTADGYGAAYAILSYSRRMPTPLAYVYSRLEVNGTALISMSGGIPRNVKMLVCGPPSARIELTLRVYSSYSCSIRGWSTYTGTLVLPASAPSSSNSSSNPSTSTSTNPLPASIEEKLRALAGMLSSSSSSIPVLLIIALLAVIALAVVFKR